MKKRKINKKEVLTGLESKLNEIFTEKLPSLPEKAKEAIVKYGPYFIVVMMVFTIPAILALVGFGLLGTKVASVAGVANGWGYIISLIVGIFVICLETMAISGLFKREKRAWKLMYYISLIQAIGYILRFDLGSLIIGSGLSWYILFQIRSYYKN